MAARAKAHYWVLLADPKEARKYVEEFDFNLPLHLRPTQLILDSGKAIDFKNMTDEESVVAAMELLRSVEIPMIMNSKNLEFWEH